MPAHEDLDQGIKIVEAIESNQQESRKALFLYLFRKAGMYNSNNKIHQFWQQHSHPVQLVTNSMIDQRLDYTHINPVVAGFVLSPNITFIAAQ